MKTDQKPRYQQPQNNVQGGNLQNQFLQKLAQEGVTVRLSLINGQALQGLVTSFDTYTLMLKVDDQPEQLVFKHALISIAAVS